MVFLLPTRTPMPFGAITGWYIWPGTVHEESGLPVAASQWRSLCGPQADPPVSSRFLSNVINLLPSAENIAERTSSASGTLITMVSWPVPTSQICTVLLRGTDANRLASGENDNDQA